MFIGCNYHKCLSVLTEENELLLRHSHLISYFHLNKDMLKKAHLWMWLFKYSVSYNLATTNILMMRNWYARCFLTIFYNHLINLYQHNSIWTIKSCHFYTLLQGTLLAQINPQVYSFFFYHKFLSSFLNFS